jgi:short-subunit dehydrogenase
MAKPNLVGQIAVVTGAAGGIGAALVERLGEAGADVWALDVDETGLAARRDEAERFGRKVETLVVDVRDGGALGSVATEVAATAGARRLGVWVNNAGIAATTAFHATEAEAFDRVMAINLGGVIHGTRAALAVMEGAGFGTIVNVASMAGHLPAPMMTSYCASKHGVVGFSRSLQAELALRASPVKLVLVSPGFIDTAIIRKGEAMGFPPWLGFMLATPATVASEILDAVKSGKPEIFPSVNAKVMRAMYRLLPRATVRSSRVLLAKSWRDLVMNRFDLP